jgi:DUF1365 family protein
MRSHLLEGTVRHRRAAPFVYAFEHEVFYFALDLSELDEVDASLRLVGRNRRNLLTFRDDDHLDPPASDLEAEVRDHLRGEGLDPEGWRITLITSLRVLGYVFNPASFYLCRDRSGTLQAVIIEVHNTHLERHQYTLRPSSPGLTFETEMEKAFYVSPFIAAAGRYTVSVRDEPSRVRITINEHEDDQLQLHTSLDLKRQRLSDRALARVLIRNPLATHKTIALIHFHALRLWRRGARFHSHGKAA